MIRVYSRSDGTTAIEEIQHVVVSYGAGPRVSEPATSVSFVRGDTESVVRDAYGLTGEGPTFHNAPARVYVFVLSGSLELEVASGDKRTLGPGEVALLEDMTGEGHISRGMAELGTVMLT